MKMLLDWLLALTAPQFWGVLLVALMIFYIVFALAGPQLLAFASRKWGKGDLLEQKIDAVLAGQEKRIQLVENEQAHVRQALEGISIRVDEGFRKVGVEIEGIRNRIDGHIDRHGQDKPAWDGEERRGSNPLRSRDSKSAEEFTIPEDIHGQN